MARQLTKMATSDSVTNSPDASAHAGRPEQEEIALLAYSHWHARGCPLGSPEDDWFRAEREIQAGKSPAGSDYGQENRGLRRRVSAEKSAAIAAG